MINKFHGEYHWLSNFFPSIVEFDGKHYATVEHAYQASKTLDPKERYVVQIQKTAGQAKKQGRLVTLRPNFTTLRVEIMRSLLVQKFAIPDLRQKLLDTGEQELIEGNTWNDTFWGKCRGKGENQLGKLLMAIRQDIQNEITFYKAATQ